MKVTYSRSEMLALRRMMAGHGPLRNDCTIEVTDGIETDDLFERQMRAWYLDLLARGPREWIAPEDISSEVSAAVLAPGGSRITLPQCCRRVFEIRLQGWHAATAVQPPEKLAEIMNRQLNPFTAATPFHPVAVLAAGADGHCGDILAWPAGSSASMLIAATDRGPDYYSFVEAALSGWKTILPDFL